MHTNTYFEFLYENIKQYDFLCIFEKLDRMHTYKTFFLCFFLKRISREIFGIFKNFSKKQIL